MYILQSPDLEGSAARLLEYRRAFREIFLPTSQLPALQAQALFDNTGHFGVVEDRFGRREYAPRRDGDHIVIPTRTIVLLAGSFWYLADELAVADSQLVSDIVACSRMPDKSPLFYPFPRAFHGLL
jgi:hypothetical protein